MMAEVNLLNLKNAISIIKRASEHTLNLMLKGENIKKQTFVLYSLPGIGKTESLKNLANTKDHIKVIDINAEFGGSLSMPIQDVSTNENGSKEALVLHALHEDINTLNEHAKENPEDVHYLFLDEFNRGDEFMKQTIMQLLLNNTLPGHQLAPNIFVVGAGNTSENIYGDEFGEVPNDVNPLDVAARDRIAPLFVKLDTNAWLDWSYQNKIHPSIIMFVEQSQNAANVLYRAPKSDDETGATPRSWTKLSHMFEIFDPTKESQIIIKPLVQAHVGSELADEFMAYISEQPTFNINDILSDKKTALKEFESLNSTEKRQAMLLMPMFIEKNLKQNARTYFESFEEIMKTKDQNALQKFINIFIQNDILRENFNHTFSALNQSEQFQDIRSKYSAYV